MNAEQDVVEAVKARDTARVKALLDTDPGLAHAHAGNNSLLLTAVYCGAKDAAELIAGHRTDLDVFEAAAIGHLARLRALLQQDPRLAAQFSADGFTPLALAAFFRQTAAVTVLLDLGADVNQMGDSTAPNVPKNTALHAALAGGAWEAAQVLLERGADVHARDDGGHTPLHSAAFGTNGGLAEAILARGADVNARDNSGKTPLAWAQERDHQEVAEVLRSHGGKE